MAGSGALARASSFESFNPPLTLTDCIASRELGASLFFLNDLLLDGRPSDSACLTPLRASARAAEESQARQSPVQQIPDGSRQSGAKVAVEQALEAPLVQGSQDVAVQLVSAPEAAAVAPPSVAPAELSKPAGAAAAASLSLPQKRPAAPHKTAATAAPAKFSRAATAGAAASSGARAASAVARPPAAAQRSASTGPFSGSVFFFVGGGPGAKMMGEKATANDAVVVGAATPRVTHILCQRDHAWTLGAFPEAVCSAPRRAAPRRVCVSLSAVPMH